MYSRLQAEQILKSKKSILLLGPRQVGKSTLVASLKPDLEINLADEQEYITLLSEPAELRRRIEATNPQTIFIDEIQRIPSLTNTVQALVDKNPKLKFYLTGSSARKLRRGNANLLPGRIVALELNPLCLSEMGKDWNELAAMQYGTLPGIVSESSERLRAQVLKTYASIYLKEEIRSESLVRNVEGFVRFLREASTGSGTYLDYSKIAQRAKLPRQTVVRHFEILEDTLLVRRLFNLPNLEGADLVRHPRYFFFDVGVLNALRGSFDISLDRTGTLFEHLVFLQIYHTANALGLEPMAYNFRTRGGLEVDFIFEWGGKRFAVECKARDSLGSDDFKALRKVKDYLPKGDRFIIYRGRKELRDEGIWALPLDMFVKRVLASP